MDKKPVVAVGCCISCGLCVSVCPEVFRFNQDGKSEAFNPQAGSESKIQQAIDGCPLQCISWQ